MIVWCTIIVIILEDGTKWKHETAAKGIVKSETKEYYNIDFSEYAEEHEYIGDYNNLTVDKDRCIKDE